MAAPKLKYRDEFPAIARSMRREGYSLKEIAKKFSVSVSTLLRWAYGHKRQASPLTPQQMKELSKALQESKEEFLANVKASLGRRAVGYNYTETKRFGSWVTNKETKKRTFIVTREERAKKRMAPDVAACMVILTNIGGWKHRQSLEHTGPDGAPLNNTNQPQVFIYLPDNNRGDNHNEPAKQITEIPQPSVN